MKKQNCKIEIKEKIRITTAKQITPIKDTSIEVKIQNFLKQLGISFFAYGKKGFALTVCGKGTSPPCCCNARNLSDEIIFPGSKGMLEIALKF